MQEDTKTQQKKFLKIADLSVEDKGKLVGAFAWLIKEDKKQNPALYKLNNIKND